MKVMRAIIYENQSIKQVPEISMLLSAFEIVSILSSTTIVNAATIKITTFENPSPIHKKKTFTSLEHLSYVRVQQ